MRRLVCSFVCVIGLLAAAPSRGATWEVDPAHSSVAFAVRHMMISTVRGQFRTFTAAAVGDPATPQEAKIEATIDVSSIDTGNEKRDTHLKSADFFDVAQFGKMTFKSKKIEPAGSGKYKVTGDLTLHGVTKEVVLEVEGPSKPVTMGNTKAGAHATAKINRKDFGLTWNKAMDGGGVVVGEDVDVTIDVEAIKKND
jgi:polyisoprenoid-binding protein YceI